MQCILLLLLQLTAARYISSEEQSLSRSRRSTSADYEVALGQHQDGMSRTEVIIAARAQISLNVLLSVSGKKLSSHVELANMMNRPENRQKLTRRRRHHQRRN